MGQIQEQFVAYVSHVQVAIQEGPRGPSATGMRFIGPDDPVQGSGALRSTAAAMPPEELMGDFDAPSGPAAASAGGNGADEVMQPVRVDKTPGRNEPCYCGSGKKYKLCHGR
jgi:hypothetical protein